LRYRKAPATGKAKYTVYPGKIPPGMRILHILAASACRTVSGDEIGEVLGISRPAVWKHVRSLLAEGFPIRPVAGRGYRLTGPLDLMMPCVIAGHLETSYIGRVMLHASATGSTNDDAKTLGAVYPDGAVFLAEVQSGGKGRIGRRWASLPGGIFMSVLLRPQIPPSRAPALSLVAGYAVATAIRESLDLDARVKWPNDVLVDGRKVCGILCEMRAEPDRVTEVVAGIGINANFEQDDLPSEVRDSATSLKTLARRPVDRNRLIADVLNRFEPCYQAFLSSGLEGLVPRIVDVCAFLGELVALKNLTAADQTETVGIYQGVDCDGRAVLRLPGGESRAFSAGDLSLRACPQG